MTANCKALVILALAVCTMSARESAPRAKTQPGFYRLMLGDFEITALNDGVVAYSTKQVLPTATPEKIAKALHAAGLVDPVGMSYNAFLINTGSKLVLIDTGTGGKLADSPFFRGTGRLVANLRAAGYEPEQVDEIYITHFGPDHVGGLTRGNERAFPNAMLHVPKGEADLVFHPDKAPEWTKHWTEFWRGLLQPYMDAGKFSSFAEDGELTPGIRAMATKGHAPGHASYVVESKGQRLIVLGDLVLLGAMQFAEPTLTSSFDSDPAAAAVQRKRILQLAADQDDWVAGAHLSFPGIGHVRQNGAQGYSWVPANYGIPH